MNKINILTKQQEDIVCKLLHYARSEEVVQYILNTIGKHNWTRDILSVCSYDCLTEEQEDIQASVGSGYTSEELDEHLYIDDVEYEIKEKLKSQDITPYLYNNDEYIEAIRLGKVICAGIDVKQIKKQISEDGLENEVLMKLHQEYDEVIDEIGIYSILSDGKWGFADLRGYVLISPKYDLNSHSGYAPDNEIVVGNRGKYFRMGLISKQGEELILPKYETLYVSDNHNVLLVKLNDKWGVVNKRDYEILPCIYDNVNIRDNKLLAIYEGKEIYFDFEGNVIKE